MPKSQNTLGEAAPELRGLEDFKSCGFAAVGLRVSFFVFSVSGTLFASQVVTEIITADCPSVL